MNNTIMYFFRHGEIENPNKIYYGRHIPMPLSNEGQRQVKLLAQKLRSQHVHMDALYTSPLHRAVTTAQILASVLRISPNNIIELAELTDVHIPKLAGKSLSLGKNIHMSGIDEYSGKYSAAGNETRAAIVRRMYSAIRLILKAHCGKVVGVVSHGDSLRFLLFRLISKNKPIPSMGVLKSIYYPPMGGGWRMSFDSKGNIVEAKLLPNGEDVTIKY